MSNYCENLDTNLTTKRNFPFLGIARYFHHYPRLERDKFKEFLYCIGFDDRSFETYLRLTSDNYKVKDINYTEVRYLHLKLQSIFIQDKNRTLNIILKVFQIEDNFPSLSEANSLQRAAEIVLEYIFSALMSVVVDYEVRRISAGVFNILHGEQ